MLPGVGAFADCRRGLDAVAGMVEALSDAVLDKGRPFLGICVGMQLLATRGLEHGETPGPRLDRRRGRRDRARAIRRCDIPHMGWNTLDARREHPRPRRTSRPDRRACTPISSIPIAFKPARPEDVIASADYGGAFAALIGRDNIVGVQFHPEKSQTLGLALIANFLRWRP